MARVTKMLSMVLGVVVGVSLLSMQASAQGVLSFSITFDPDSLTISQADSFDAVTYPGCSYTAELGEPMLPQGGIHIVIPTEAVVDSVVITYATTDTIPGKYWPLPAQEPDTISTGVTDRPFIGADTIIYRSSSSYPDSMLVFAHQGYLSGYAIAALFAYPVQFVPADSMLVFHETMNFALHYSPGGPAPAPMSKISENSRRIIESTVKALVINPEDVITFELPEGDYDYVVIVGSALSEYFQPLIDWKTQKGIPACTATLEEIYNDPQYDGLDAAEEVRNFIIDAHDTWGATWFLLGGDKDSFPKRTCKVEEYPALDALCDLYYSDLDGDWNANPDEEYGQPDDGLDLYPDVHVGRACVSTPAEVSVFVDKVLTYEKWPPLHDYARQMLYMAFTLDQTTQAGVFKDQYITPMLPMNFEVTRKYSPSTHQECLDAMNAGPNVINHSAHSQVCQLGIDPGNDLTCQDMNALMNDSKQSVLYSTSCWTAAFDFTDCVAEHFMNNPNGGGVAYIGSSRASFHSPVRGGNYDTFASMWGPALDRAFMSALFQSSHCNIGWAHSDSKIGYVDLWREGSWRYTLYEFNLLGDPEMPIWTDDPHFMEVDFFNIQMPVGQQSQLLTHVTESGTGGTLVDNALFCLSGCGVYETGFTTEGTILAYVTPTTTGHICLTVSKHNFIPYVTYGKACLGIPDLIIRDWGNDVVFDDGRMPSWDGNGNARFDGIPPDRGAWQSPDVLLDSWPYNGIPGEGNEYTLQPGRIQRVYAYVKNHSGQDAIDTRVNFSLFVDGIALPDMPGDDLGGFTVPLIEGHHIETNSYIEWEVPLDVPERVRIKASASSLTDPIVAGDCAWDNNIAGRGFHHLEMSEMISNDFGASGAFSIWNPDSSSTQDVYLTLYEEDWPPTWTCDLTSSAAGFSQIDSVTYVIYGMEPKGVTEATINVLAPAGAENDSGTVHVAGTITGELIGGVTFPALPPSSGASIDTVLWGPCVPLPFETVAVAAVVTDDSAVDSVQIIYTVDGGPAATLDMPRIIGDLYQAIVPGEGDGALVQFRIQAIDDGANVTLSGLYGYYSGTVSIGTIRENDLQGRSIYESYGVRVSGIAMVGTGVFREAGNGVDIYVQDLSGGIPGGINVFDETDSTLVNPGDSVVVEGLLEQQNGALRIGPCGGSGLIDKVGAGSVPAPVTVTLSDLGEEHEGLLIRVSTVTNIDSVTSWPGEGLGADLAITDGAATRMMRIDPDTDIDGSPEPAWPNDVTGICIQDDGSLPYSGDYLLQPRSLADFSSLAAVAAPAALSSLPKVFSLDQNYPNPFNPTTVIKYALPVACQVMLEVYNVAGQRVATLVNERQEAGIKTVEWDGSNHCGEVVASGIYFFRLEADRFAKTRKLVLLR